MEAHFPDPVVTANVYCDRRQDEAVHRGLAPLRQAMADRDPEGIWRLWFIRYAKRGDHLKVRLHGPEAAAPVLRELLADAVVAFLSGLPAADDGAQRQDGAGAPPIDPEDAADGLHADRSLLWTQAPRSPVSLGGGPLLGDDSYAAWMTTCLARGCEIVLAALQPNAAGQFLHGPRQTALFRLVIGGLGALGFAGDENAVYLAYHRDWLLRFTSSRAGAGPEKAAQLLAQFNRRADEMGNGLAPLRAMAAEAWAGGPRDSLDGTDAAWWQALRGLQSSLERFRGNPDYQLDPFTTNVVFSPVFKVFHGCANQLGLNMLNEALAYHLLARAVAE